MRAVVADGGNRSGWRRHRQRFLRRFAVRIGVVGAEHQAAWPLHHPLQRHHDAHPAVDARPPVAWRRRRRRLPPPRLRRPGCRGAVVIPHGAAASWLGELDGHIATETWEGEGRWRSSAPREHAEGEGQSPVGAETVTERPSGAASGLAPLERPNRLFDPSQALSVRLARLGLAPEAEQTTKQTKFGPNEPWPGLATNQTHPMCFHFGTKGVFAKKFVLIRW